MDIPVFSSGSHTRRKEIALILVISMCLPYLSATFLEHYEQRRARQAAELLQEQQQQALEEQNTALEHFSELVTRSDYTAALDEINHLLSLDSANPQILSETCRTAGSSA